MISEQSLRDKRRLRFHRRLISQPRQHREIQGSSDPLTEYAAAKGANRLRELQHGRRLEAWFIQYRHQSSRLGTDVQRSQNGQHRTRMGTLPPNGAPSTQCLFRNGLSASSISTAKMQRSIDTLAKHGIYGTKQFAFTEPQDWRMQLKSSPNSEGTDSRDRLTSKDGTIPSIGELEMTGQVNGLNYLKRRRGDFYPILHKHSL